MGEHDWYIYDKFVGTGEELNLVEMINSLKDELDKKYKDNFHLCRSERAFKLYNFKDGEAFEPDFFLIATNKKMNYHIFIESKGAHLKEHDRWKEDFLKEITELF